MKRCLEGKPELRPTFADISRTLTTKILPEIPPSEDQTLENNTKGEDESLFESIVGSLSDDLKGMGWDTPTTSPINGRRSDYYTDIIPKAAVTKVKRKVSFKNDYYNQVKPNSTAIDSRDLKTSQNESDNSFVLSNGHAVKATAVPSKLAGVKRSASNVSDYFPMFAAEPVQLENRSNTYT